ncbi:MAG: hypothetical protein ACF8NJ_10910 [Phycisphaerales bacterium JB038]
MAGKRDPDRLTPYQSPRLDALTLWVGYVLPALLTMSGLTQLVLWRGFWLASASRSTTVCTSRDWVTVIGFSAAAFGAAASIFIYRILIVRYHRPSLVWLVLSLLFLIVGLVCGYGRAFFLGEDQYSEWMIG